MNKLVLLILAGLSFALISSCGDPEDDKTDFSYHAHIHSPNADDKHMADTLKIKVDFESHTGEAVHHININVAKKDDMTVVYSEPNPAHIHETDGEYTFEADVILSSDNGFAEHTDYILEAKVWGDDGEQSTVVATIEFHVHPE